MHKKMIRLAVAACFGMGMTGMTAIAADKTGDAFTNDGTAGSGAQFVNCSSSGQYKSGGTAIQIKLKKLVGLADSDQLPCTGDEVICVIHSTVSGSLIPGGSSASTTVVRGEVKSSGVSIKVDLCKLQPALCPPSEVHSYDNDVICYLPIAGYNPAFFLALPPPNQCMGVDLSALPDPASPRLARQGQTTGCP